MSRFTLDPTPEFPDHSVAVGYEKHLGSFYAYVIGADGTPIVTADGLLTAITDPAEALDAVRPYAVIPDDLPARLAAMPAVELTATQRAQRR